jgi:U3 small nucleolar RNA-associated protein 18
MDSDDEGQLSWNPQSSSESEGISDSEQESALKLTKTHRAAAKDEEEEELERLIFGGHASFRENLFKSEISKGSESSLKDLSLEAGPAEEDTGLGDLDDSALFDLGGFDTARPQDGGLIARNSALTVQEDADGPVWEDSDDERLTISLASVSRLRKLRETEADDVIDGVEYTRRLRLQYLRLNPLPAWASAADGREPKRRRHSSASSTSSSGSNAEGIENALPLDSFLRSVTAMAGVGTGQKRKLRPEVLNIQKTREIPGAHKEAVGSLAFHPKYPVLLSCSTSSIMNLNRIDPTAHPTPNPLLTSVQVQRVPLRRAEFVGPNGDRVVFAGRRKYMHGWELATGRVQRVRKIQGHDKEHKSMERFRASPCGRYLAVAATDRKGGGMLNVVAVSNMQWLAQARLDSRGGIADFAWWSTGDGITILGRDGSVGEYNLEDRRFVGTWYDQGSIGGTVLGLGGHGGPPSLGDDRWVSVGSRSGIVNIYDRADLLASSGKGEISLKPQPEPKRVFEQLITPVTVISFTPDGQLMAFGSQQKRDALRLAHLPSCTVYRNWPTDQTPLGRITAVAFGAKSDVLAVGNDAGKIRLWEIRA